MRGSVGDIKAWMAWALLLSMLSCMPWAQAQQQPHPRLQHAPHERVMGWLDEGIEQELIVVFDDAAAQKSTDQWAKTKNLDHHHPLVWAHRVAQYQQDKNRS